MIHWAWLILALIIGGIVGMGTMALCVAASWEINYHKENQ